MTTRTPALAAAVIPSHTPSRMLAPRAAYTTAAGDVQVLINNAGISTGTPLITGDLTSIRRAMETNFYGPPMTIRAFAPILGANVGGAIINVVSALSWFTAPGAGAYAAHPPTQSSGGRQEVSVGNAVGAPRRVLTLGLQIGEHVEDCSRAAHGRR